MAWLRSTFTDEASADGQAVHDLVRKYNLRLTGNFYENRIGQGEKWLPGDDAWYLIKRDGSVFRWNGSLADSQLVGTFGTAYHVDPSKLYEAKQP